MPINTTDWVWALDEEEAQKAILPVPHHLKIDLLEGLQGTSRGWGPLAIRNVFEGLLYGTAVCSAGCNPCAFLAGHPQPPKMKIAE